MVISGEDFFDVCRDGIFPTHHLCAFSFSRALVPLLFLGRPQCNACGGKNQKEMFLCFFFFKNNTSRQKVAATALLGFSYQEVRSLTSAVAQKIENPSVINFSKTTKETYILFLHKFLITDKHQIFHDLFVHRFCSCFKKQHLFLAKACCVYSRRRGARPGYIGPHQINILFTHTLVLM